MKLLIYFTILTLCFSCSNTKEKTIGTFDEVGIVMSGYVDTLEGSIKDAKVVIDLMNQNGEDLQKSIENNK